MARIRTIKPSIWTDPTFVECSMAARLLWIGAWNFADDYGVLKDDPAQLRLQIFPGDDIDTYDLVDELVSRRMVLRKVAPDGTNVLVIRTFCIHQKIDTRSPGRWGKPEDFTDPEPPCTPVDLRECTSPSQSQPFPTNPNPVLEGTGPSFLVNPDGSTDPEGEAFEGTFSECWEHYPRKQGRKEALRAYQARRRSGVAHRDLLTATRHYAAQCHGKDRQYVMHGKRFYGPNEVWRDYLEEPASEPVDRSAEVVER